MIFLRFLSFVGAGGGGGRITRLLIGITRLVLFALSAAIFISKSICFHLFSTWCLWTGIGEAALWLTGGMEAESRHLFLSYRRRKVWFSRPGIMSFSVRLFLAVFISFISGQLVVPIGWWHQNQAQVCCHPGGLQLTCSLVLLLKMRTNDD